MLVITSRSGWLLELLTELISGDYVEKHEKVMFQEVSSVTLGVETPELCQQICQVPILRRSSVMLSVLV